MRGGKSREHRKRIAKEAIGLLFSIVDAKSMKGHHHDGESVD